MARNSQHLSFIIEEGHWATILVNNSFNGDLRCVRLHHKELLKVGNRKYGSFRYGNLDLLESTIYDQCPLELRVFEALCDRVYDNLEPLTKWF